MEKKRVILDTDTGVDDAMAIILALRSPELQVEAITTVSGNVHVDLCTQNVLRVLALLELTHPPPVAKGAERPLVKEPFAAPSIHGKDGLGELGEDYYPPLPTSCLLQESAVDLILTLIAQHPGELTLIPTGPLTNIAAAICKDPRTMRKVKEIILMGGAVHVPGNIPPGAAEFNIYVDPHAAAKVCGFGIPIVMVPLDVTHKVPLLRERAQQELGNSRGRIPRFILDATQKYRDFYRDDQEHDGCYLHDPLAVGVAIDLSFVRKEERRVYVETEGKETRGMTLPFQHPTIKKAPSNVSVCVEVESERFLRFFLQRLKG